MNKKIQAEVERLFHSNPCLLFDDKKLRQIVAVVFDVTLPDTWQNNIVDVIDNLVLEKYFSKVWQPKTKKYKYSGLDIIDRINEEEPNLVVDLGCGYNEFKGKIKNLQGVDPYNHRADVKCGLLDYYAQDVDCVICFGSINFGNTEKIIAEVGHALAMTRTGGKLFFRVNPGIQHDAPEARWIDFFNWSPGFVIRLADQFNVEVKAMSQDNDRLYFELHK